MKKHLRCKEMSNIHSEPRNGALGENEIENSTQEHFSRPAAMKHGIYMGKKLQLNECFD